MESWFFAVVPNKYAQANIVRLLNAISLEVVDLKKIKQQNKSFLRIGKIRSLFLFPS